LPHYCYFYIQLAFEDATIFLLSGIN